MQVSQNSHLVTPTEIAAAKLLGFEVKGVSSSEHEFFNKHFPNFDVFRLLKDINDILTPLCVTDVERTVQLFDTVPPKVSIRFCTNDFDDPVTGLALMRLFTFENDELIVKHAFFRIPEAFRHRSIAKQVFQTLLQQYINMGVRKIKVHAALVDGGYVWAKHFFTADNMVEMAKILKEARDILNDEQFEPVEQIFNNYYTKNPDGKAFPINKWAYLPFMENVLRGSEWNGTIDLKNPEQFNNFMKYVIR